MAEQHQIPVLAKSVRVLEAIAGGMHSYSVAELARELHIATTTCYRIIQTLIAAGWLRPRSSGVGYELSFGILSLMRPFLNHRILIDTVRDEIEKLVRRTGWSAKLSVRQADQAVTIFRVDAQQPMTVTGRVGVQFHVAFGSSGACLLSGLDDPQIDAILSNAPKTVWKRQTPDDVRKRIIQCRRDNYCIDRGQFHPSIHTLSAALRDADNQPIAALTLLSFADDVQPDSFRRHRKALVETARRCRQRICSDPHLLHGKS